MRTDKIVGETMVAFKQSSLLKAGVKGRGPSITTLLRWSKIGLVGKNYPNGKPITLEYCYIGGRLFTSVEAFHRWLAKINAP